MMNISRVVNFSWFTFKWLQSTISYTLKSTKLPILLTIQEIKDFVQNEGISRTERYISILQKEISCNVNHENLITHEILHFTVIA